MFKILGQDNKEYGPIDAGVLRQWIAERRADAQTQVQPEGHTGFIPLGQLPEFQSALAQAAASIPRPAAPPTSSAGEKSSGLAVTSMVLGIFSFIILPFIAAVPAIITGHIALSRIRRDPGGHGGKGQATAGLVLGYVNIAFIPVIAVLAGLLLPALAKAKDKAQRINCVSNLKMIGLAARMYANDNKEVLPVDFMSMSNELSTPKILVCPGDGTRTRALDWSTFSESGNVTYEFLRPGGKGIASQEPTFRCPIHNNVGLADGSVMQLPRNARR